MASWRILREDYGTIARIVTLGIFSGFPQIFVGSLFALWLQSAGISKSTIGALGMVTLFYAFNWLLAPLADSFTALGLDRRRFWLLLCQGLMLVAGGVLSQLDLSLHFYAVVAGVMVIAFASALQDVSIDAMRIELTPPERPDLLALGSACAVVGWNTGFYLGSALGLRLFAAMEAGGEAAPVVWSTVYGWLTLGFALMMMVTLLWLRPRYGVMPKMPDKKSGHWLETVFLEPFRAFCTTHGVKSFVLILAFVFLFKLGEAFLGRMAMVFYKEVGFTETQIADYVKIIGWVVISLFALLSGFIASRFGVWRGLMIGGLAMASTNLLYALLAMVGPNVNLLLVTVVADQFTSAFATVSFVTFISALCSREYTASQYALFASVGNGARILLASSSGYMLEHWLDNSWPWFFVLTAVMVIPGLILLWLMRDRMSMNARCG